MVVMAHRQYLYYHDNMNDAAQLSRTDPMLGGGSEVVVSPPKRFLLFYVIMIT